MGIYCLPSTAIRCWIGGTIRWTVVLQSRWSHEAGDTSFASFSPHPHHPLPTPRLMVHPQCSLEQAKQQNARRLVRRALSVLVFFSFLPPISPFRLLPAVCDNDGPHRLVVAVERGRAVGAELWCWVVAIMDVTRSCSRPRKASAR